MGSNKNKESSGYNLELINKYLEIASGERSLRQYSIAAELSPSFLYKVKNGDYKLSPQAMRQLTSEKANPQGNIGFTDLMCAAGYEDEDEKASGMLLEFRNKQEDSLTEDEGTNETETLEKRRQRVSEYRRKENSFEKVAEGIILKALLDKDIEYSSVPEAQNQKRRHRGWPDIRVKIKKREIKEWWIDFRYFEKEGRTSRFVGSRLINILFGKLMMTPSNKKRKISIAVNNEAFFEQIAEFSGKLSYRGELSVILIDTENFKVKKEVYLSHFDENDKSIEITLSK